MAAVRAALAFALLSGLFGAARGVRVRAAARSTVEMRSGYKVISVPSHFIEVSRDKISSLPVNLSIGDLVAYEPAKPVTDDLFLFLAGSTNDCKVYSELLETAGKSMRTVCMPYDNRVMIGKKCLVIKSCYTRLRLQAMNGTFGAVKGNNVEDRLVSTLRYLAAHEGGDWGRYLDKTTGQPLWASIRAAGHSQGAGNAAMLGYAHKLARVVQFSGICDQSDWPEKMAPPATPGERWFAIGHAADHICLPFKVQKKHWQAEGALREGEQPKELHDRSEITPSFLGGSHSVISYISAPDCEAGNQKKCGNKDHESVAGMVWGDKGSPYVNGLWQSLVGI